MIIKYFVFIILVLSLQGCFNKRKTHAFHGKTMGTTYNIKVIGNLHESETIRISKGIEAVLADVNQKMSTYIPDSEISRLNSTRANTSFSLSDDPYFLIKEALLITKLTSGRYDITVGPLVNLWGFGPSKRETDSLPSEKQVKDLLKLIGPEAYFLNTTNKSITKNYDGVYFDLSSIAKGWAVDKISELLKSKKINDFMVEIGGEVRTSGLNKKEDLWTIGIESPTGKGLSRIVSLDNQSLATSGNYRNYFSKDGEKFSHTINPITGHPQKSAIISASVMTTNCWQADAFATAFMVSTLADIKKIAASTELEALAPSIYIIYSEKGELKEWMNEKFVKNSSAGAVE